MARCLPCERGRTPVIALGNASGRGPFPRAVLERHAAEHRAMRRRGIRGRRGVADVHTRPETRAFIGALAVVGLGALALWYVTS